MNKKDFQKKADIAPNKDDTGILEEQIGELRQKISSLETQLEEKEENWKRALADYKNLERRTIKEKEETAKFANFILIAELIVVHDNLDMLKRHSEDKGLIMIADQFAEILENAGLTKMDVIGKDFDEAFMEAVDTQEGAIPSKIKRPKDLLSMAIFLSPCTT